MKRGFSEESLNTHGAADCSIQAVIKVDEGVAGPEAAMEFLTMCDHFPAVLQKNGEDLTRLLLKL